MDEIFGSTAEFLVQTGRLSHEQLGVVLEGLREHERQHPTVIGNGCALPHFYDDAIDAPMMVFVRLHRPVNMGAPDGAGTQFVFVLLGPTRIASDHLDTLASVARLMADSEFHYEASVAKSKDDLLEAIDRHVARLRPPADATPRVTGADDLKVEGGIGAGLLADVRRRLPHYVDDVRDGLKSKSAAATLFMFFACLAPAIAFGGIMGEATGQAIGTVEMLVATSVCGVLYVLLAGQPLILLGGVGPLLIFTIILFRLTDDLQMGDQFLAIYGWVGLWTGLFTVLLAVTNASGLMRYFTRFTDEIFSALMSLIFIYEAVKALVGIFHGSFSDPDAPHDVAFLSLLVALGTFYVATQLSQFRKSAYLLPWMREFLADFGPSIALAVMAVVAWWLSGEVVLPTLTMSSGLTTSSGRPWQVDLNAAPVWIRFAAAGPALLATLLVYLTQNITARLVNSPENKLRKGAGYHLDLAVVGGMIAGCSLFGLPWLCAATVRSLAHLRALATVEEVTSPSGDKRDRVLHVDENRVTAFVIHLLIGGSLFLAPILGLVPKSTLYGLFLYMGFVSLGGNQFVERLSLWLMDSAMYPATHYMRRVSIRTIHLYTLLQFVCLVVLCVVNLYPSEIVQILFPVFIALLVPVRFLAAGWFPKEDLAVLDSDEEPEEEEQNWV